MSRAFCSGRVIVRRDFSYDVGASLTRFALSWVSDTHHQLQRMVFVFWAWQSPLSKRPQSRCQCVARKSAANERDEWWSSRDSRHRTRRVFDGFCLSASQSSVKHACTRPSIVSFVVQRVITLFSLLLEHCGTNIEIVRIDSMRQRVLLVF